MALAGKNRLGVKLDPFDIQFVVTKSHDQIRGYVVPPVQAVISKQAGNDSLSTTNEW